MIPYEEAKAALLINIKMIDDEIVTQPSYQAEVGETLAKMAGHRDAAKEELAAIDAQIYSEIMSQDSKLADAKIKAQVIQDERHKKAFDRYHTLKLETDVWESLYDAVKQRGFMLTQLVDLITSGYLTPQTRK